MFDPTAGQLCASVDALIAGLKKELEKSGQLDQSVASLMRAGASGEATRASSALSDASEGEEPTSINGRIQHLMNKIHSEGIEVTSLFIVYLFTYSFPMVAWASFNGLLLLPSPKLSRKQTSISLQCCHSSLGYAALENSTSSSLGNLPRVASLVTLRAACG